MSKIRIKGDTSGFVDLETSATGSNLSVTGNALKVDTINEKTTGNGVHIPGHMVQFQSNTSGAVSYNNSTTSYIASGVFMDFTPKFSNSIVLVTYQSRRFNLVTAPVVQVKCMRDATTNIGLSTAGSGVTEAYYQNNNTSGANQIAHGAHYMWQDNPGTTSSVRYELYFAASVSGNGYLADNGGVQLYIQEIAQ